MPADVEGEPVLRVPLSEAEAHKAQLAAALAEVAGLREALKAEFDGAMTLRKAYGARDDETFTMFVGRLADLSYAARRAIYDAAFADDGPACLLRQSVKPFGQQGPADVDVVASITAFANKAKSLAAHNNEQACKIVDLENALAAQRDLNEQLAQQWREQCAETQRYCALYLDTAEGKAKGAAQKAASEEVMPCGHLRIERVNDVCVLCKVRDAAPPKKKARASKKKATSTPLLPDNDEVPDAG